METSLSDGLHAPAQAPVGASFELDVCSRWLGIKIEETRLGYARLTMRVSTDFLDHRMTCHRGLLFTLAQSALAVASGDREFEAAFAGATVEYLQAVRAGEVITAEARQSFSSERRCVYDITLTDTSGKPVALVRNQTDAY